MQAGTLVLVKGTLSKVKQGEAWEMQVSAFDAKRITVD
jgi:hypothetical protein